MRPILLNRIIVFSILVTNRSLKRLKIIRTNEFREFQSHFFTVQLDYKKSRMRIDSKMFYLAKGYMQLSERKFNMQSFFVFCFLLFVSGVFDFMNNIKCRY